MEIKNMFNLVPKPEQKRFEFIPKEGVNHNPYIVETDKEETAWDVLWKAVVKPRLRINNELPV